MESVVVVKVGKRTIWPGWHKAVTSMTKQTSVLGPSTA